MEYECKSKVNPLNNSLNNSLNNLVQSKFTKYPIEIFNQNEFY